MSKLLKLGWYRVSCVLVAGMQGCSGVMCVRGLFGYLFPVVMFDDLGRIVLFFVLAWCYLGEGPLPCDHLWLHVFPFYPCVVLWCVVSQLCSKHYGCNKHVLGSTRSQIVQGFAVHCSTNFWIHAKWNNKTTQTSIDVDCSVGGMQQLIRTTGLLLFMYMNKAIQQHQTIKRNYNTMYCNNTDHSQTRKYKLLNNCCKLQQHKK